METERAPTRGEIGEDGVKFGIRGDHRGELVHDDDQTRQDPRRQLLDAAARARRALALADEFGAETGDRATAIRASRSVSVPSTWAMARRGVNAAPPLKSTRRKVTSDAG